MTDQPATLHPIGSDHAAGEVMALKELLTQIIRPVFHGVELTRPAIVSAFDRSISELARLRGSATDESARHAANHGIRVLQGIAADMSAPAPLPDQEPQAAA